MVHSDDSYNNPQEGAVLQQTSFEGELQHTGCLEHVPYKVRHNYIGWQQVPANKITVCVCVFNMSQLKC